MPCNRMTDCQRLHISDFAGMFGIPDQELPLSVASLIDQTDFSYFPLTREQRDEVLIEVLSAINSGRLSRSGEERKGAWEAGWAENLQLYLRSSRDPDALKPRYYRPNRVVRLRGDYVSTRSSTFEFDFFRVLREWVVNTQLVATESIYEFGCGSCHNLPVFSRVFPNTEIYGLDWARSAVQIAEEMGQRGEGRVHGRHFDMLSPDRDLKMTRDSVAVTIGSMEQLGSEYDKFLQYLVSQKLALVCHIEPFFELYDQANLLDYLGAKYHEARGYLYGYLTQLRQLHSERAIELRCTHRVKFGGKFHEGWSIVIWRPTQ